MVLIKLKGRLTDGAGSLGQPEISYFTQIHLGSPPQRFKVQFELALDNHFLPHYSYWQPWRSSLKYNQGYKASRSQTGTKKFDTYYSMRYQNCEFLGRLNEDNVKFDSWNQYRDKNGKDCYGKSSVGIRLNFLAIDLVDKNYFSRLPIHGMLGLAPSLQSDTIGCKNLLMKMLDEGLVHRAFMSLWFNAKLLEGELLLGGSDPKKYKGRVHWHNSDTCRWTIDLVGVRIGSFIIDQRLPAKARLSSAINQIHAPISIVERIYSLFQVRQDPKSGLAWIKEEHFAKLPDIVLSTEAVEIRLESSSYLGKQGDRYFLQIVAGSNDREWTLGTTFLQNVYSIFDINDHKVGFARQPITPIENLITR